MTTLDAASPTAVRLVERLGFVDVGRRTGAKGEILEYILPFRETLG